MDEPQQRSALLSGSLPPLDLPLHDLSHPIIGEAIRRYSGDTEPDRRDLIRDVRDHRWAKCRHGERWRGVVLCDPDRDRWLCYAGIRTEGDNGDVYAAFTRKYETNGESDAYLPNSADDARLKGEEGFRYRRDADLKFRQLVLNTVIQAIAERNQPHTVTLPSGTEVQLELSTGTTGGPEDDWICDLHLCVRINWNSPDRGDVVTRVQDAIPGVVADDWVVDPGIHDNGVPRFFAMVDDKWAVRVLDGVKKHGSASVASDPVLVLDLPDGLAHWSRQASVNAGYIDGQPLVTLCGNTFVPHNNPDGRPVCPRCGEVKSAVETAEGLLGISDPA